MTKELAPYDMTLKEMSKDEKEAWADETVKQMKSQGLNPEKDKFVFLTGGEYMKPLLKYIPESNMEKPMEGKRMGERLKWLNSQINEVFTRLKKLIYEILKK